MKKGDISNAAMLAGQRAEHSISLKNSRVRDAINRLVHSRPEKIIFGGIKLKLFSFYLNLMRILFILYN
jgi:hypothetical protein